MSCPGNIPSSDIQFIMRQLNKKKDNNSKLADKGGHNKVPTKRQLSPEIAKLTGQYQDKLKVSDEKHLLKSDPNYGTPLAGSLTALRGQQAHQDICAEIIEMCQTGKYRTMVDCILNFIDSSLGSCQVD